jgi:hypothetical protein
MQLNTAFGARMLDTIASIGVSHLQVPPDQGMNFLMRVRNRPDVDCAEFDSTVEAFSQPDGPYLSTAYATFKHGTISQWGTVSRFRRKPGGEIICDS